MCYWKRRLSAVAVFLALYSAAAWADVGEKVRDLAAGYFVKLEISPQEDNGEVPQAKAWGIPCPNCGMVHANSFQESIQEQKTIDIWGMMVDSEGTALFPDPLIEPRFIKGVSVRDFSGNKFSASLVGALPESALIVVKVQGGKWKRPEFSKSAKPAYAVITEERMGRPSLRVFQVGRTMHYSNSGYWLEVPPRAMIFGPKGELLGYSCRGRLGLKGQIYPWRFEHLLKMIQVRFDDLSSETAVSALCETIAEVQFKYREVAAGAEAKDRWFYSWDGEQEEEINPDVPGYYYQYKGGQEYIDPEGVFYAVPVGPDTVLLPLRLPKKRVERIKEITVKIQDKELKGRFLGVHKEFWAMLIGLPEPVISVAPVAEPQFNPENMIRTVFIRQIGGERKERVWYDRPDDFQKGKKNVWRPYFMGEPKLGRVFFTGSGQILGIELATRMARAKMEGDYSSSDTIDFYSFQELRQMLENHEEFAGKSALACGVDSSWVPVDEREEKRLVWFGVEFQTINKNLARINHVEGPTRDGEIGLLVSHVYKGSPADKMGIKVGDILLEVTAPGEAKPIELKDSGRGRGYPWDMLQELGNIPEEYKEQYLAGMPPPWPSTDNTLNNMLTEIGPGEKVMVHFWSNAQDLHQEIVLEKGPYDFESADRFHAEELGLHVRDLTYEVRRYYALEPDYKGVVVARIEKGSKASVAKILPYEIIIQINGKPLSSAAQFSNIFNELKKEGVVSLEFKVQCLAKTRIVKIDL